MPNSDHITFEVEQTPNGNWHVVAYCPGTVRGVTSFKSQHEAKTWIASSRSSEWAQTWMAQNGHDAVEGPPSRLRGPYSEGKREGG